MPASFCTAVLGVLSRRNFLALSSGDFRRTFMLGSTALLGALRFAATAGGALAASGLDAFVGIIRFTSSGGDVSGFAAPLISVGGVISPLLSLLASAGVDTAGFLFQRLLFALRPMPAGILTRITVYSCLTAGLYYVQIVRER